MRHILDGMVRRATEIPIVVPFFPVLKSDQGAAESLSGLGSYFDSCNCERPHQGPTYQAPQDVLFPFAERTRQGHQAALNPSALPRAVTSQPFGLNGGRRKRKRGPRVPDDRTAGEP